MKDTPPKKGFGLPLRLVPFPPPSGVIALLLLYKNPRRSRPETRLEGSKVFFWEGALSGTFSSPIRFAPPYHDPKYSPFLCITSIF